MLSEINQHFSRTSRAIAVALAVLSLATAARPATAQQITLKQAIAMAQQQGYQATQAVATRDAARASNDAFGARNLPQLSLSGMAPRYEKAIVAAPQPDGTTLFTPVQQTTASAGLTIAQRLPFTGGNLSITSSLQRYERTGSNQELSWSSNPVVFALEQPILRANAMRWEGRREDIVLDVAERAYLEAREGVAVRATMAFFDLFIARRQLDNAEFNAATNDTLYNLNKGRLEIGKIGENDLLQSELALLRSRSAFDNAKLEYARALASFRTTINLPDSISPEIVIPAEVPVLNPDTAIAVAQALRNRAVVSQMELQDVTARQRIAEARWNNGMGATINASVGFNQTAPDMGLVYQDLLQAQRFQLGVSIPVIQWGARSAAIQEARAQKRGVDASSKQSREELIQEAHFAALQLAQARRNLDVSAKADTVAAKRFEVAYNRYVIGRIGVDNLYIAQNEKDQAVTQYLQSLRNYWVAYYRLRQITLYDFEAHLSLR